VKEIESYSVAQVALELSILLFQPPKYWNYRHIPPHPDKVENLKQRRNTYVPDLVLSVFCVPVSFFQHQQMSLKVENTCFGNEEKLNPSEAS
jgi:hypothetical protein